MAKFGKEVYFKSRFSYVIEAVPLKAIKNFHRSLPSHADLPIEC